MITDYTPSYDDKQVNQSGRRKRLKTGRIQARVTAVTAKINDNGNMMLVETYAPVDDENNTASPTGKHNLVLPFRTPPEALKEAGLPPDAQESVPDTIGLMIQYLEATRPGLLPKNQSIKPFGRGKSKEWQVVDAEGNPTGEALAPKETRDQINYERKKGAFDFFSKAWTDTESLKGDEFFATVIHNTVKTKDGEATFVNLTKLSADQGTEPLNEPPYFDQEEAVSNGAA